MIRAQARPRCKHRDEGMKGGQFGTISNHKGAVTDPKRRCDAEI
jgi:hypothetical protein